MREGSGPDPFGWVGSVIDGRYRVDEVVGEGGFGVVYKGRHLGFDEPVAIKCLKLDEAVPAAKRELFLQGFVSEGRILYRLSQDSTNIVRATDVGAAVSPNGTWTPYLVLEWVRGRTLADDLEARAKAGKGGRSLEEAYDLLEPAARAIDTAHSEGIVHRDIKPPNLLLTEIKGQRTIKVLDFGVAKVMSQASSVGVATVPGTLLRAFSPSHGAPEQFDGRFGSTGPWTDVFALGLVFVEVVSGQAAFAGDEPSQFHAQATNASRRPTLGSLGAATSDAVEHVLQCALAVDPRSRYATAGKFWDALGKAIHGEVAALRPVGSQTTTDDAGGRAARPRSVTESDRPRSGPAPPPAAAPTVEDPAPRTTEPVSTRRTAHEAGGPAPGWSALARSRLWLPLVLLALVSASWSFGSGLLREAPASRAPVTPPATSVPPAPPFIECQQPCCGGAGCSPLSDDPERTYQKICDPDPASPGCRCISGLACVPGSCRSVLRDGERFELRLGALVDSLEGNENGCRTALRNSRVCVHTAGAPSWQCALVADTCESDGGPEFGGARLGPRGLVVTTQDLTRTGLDVIVDSDGRRQACLDGSKARYKAIHINAECVGLVFKGFVDVGTQGIDTVMFYIAPLTPRAPELAADVTWNPTSGTTTSQPCMSCWLNGQGMVTCDPRDERCSSCFTRSDCCQLTGAAGGERINNCAALGWADPRCAL